MKKVIMHSLLLILLASTGIFATISVNPETPVLSIEKVGDNLLLDWDDIPGATSYQVYEADTPEGPWTPIMPATAASEYLIASLVTKKFYRVSSIGNTGPVVPENFVYVEGGTFHNGTGNVTISSFYMNKYEVTQAEFQSVDGWDPSHFTGNPDFPVEYVSWVQAVKYCNDLSIREGFEPCYGYYYEGTDYGTDMVNWPKEWNSDPYYLVFITCNWSANGYRLPTEMEWMYAAKGGNLTPPSGYSTYAGSNVIGNVAWYASNSGGSPHSVGTKLPNELGIYDMSGNIREWCWGFYSPYPTEDQTDPRGDVEGNGEYRIARGGDWYSAFDTCTITERSDSYISGTEIYMGFRVVRGSL